MENRCGIGWFTSTLRQPVRNLSFFSLKIEKKPATTFRESAAACLDAAAAAQRTSCSPPYTYGVCTSHYTQ